MTDYSLESYDFKALAKKGSPVYTQRYLSLDEGDRYVMGQYAIQTSKAG